MEDDTDEKETEYIKIDNEREHHWILVFKDNDAGVDDKNALLHSNSWDV